MINASYISRVLRLTLLAPDFLEAILDGRQGRPSVLQPDGLLKPLPAVWESRRGLLFTDRMGLINVTSRVEPR